jgi:hypothetical protein
VYTSANVSSADLGAVFDLPSHSRPVICAAVHTSVCKPAAVDGSRPMKYYLLQCAIVERSL